LSLFLSFLVKVKRCKQNLVCVCISGCRQQPQSSSVADGRKHCLLMDEVDGMAGNEDRGGVQVVALSVFAFTCALQRCIH